MVLENVSLPYYTEKEDKANSISHLVGVIFGVAATAVLLTRSHDIGHIISSIIFGVAMIILYSGSSIYHRLSPGKAKKIARLVDHSVIFVLITGTSIPLMILDVLPYYKALAITCISVSVVTALLGIVLTFIDQEKYKKLQMVLYMVLGWMCIFLFYPIYKCDPNALLLFGSFSAAQFILSARFSIQSADSKDIITLSSTFSYSAERSRTSLLF